MLPDPAPALCTNSTTTSTITTTATITNNPITIYCCYLLQLSENTIWLATQEHYNNPKNMARYNKKNSTGLQCTACFVYC